MQDERQRVCRAGSFDSVLGDKQVVVRSEGEEDNCSFLTPRKRLFADSPAASASKQSPAAESPGSTCSPSSLSSGGKKVQQSLAQMLGLKVKHEPLGLLERTLQGEGQAGARVQKKLAEAREAGEKLMLVSAADLDALVEKRMKKRGRAGRPPMLADLEKRSNEDLKSNRRMPGSAKRRREESAGTKLQICEAMQKQEKEFSSPAEYRKEMEQQFGMSWKQLRNVKKKESQWKQIAEAAGTGRTLQTRKQGANQWSKKRQRKGGLGCRAKGGGRKDMFRHVKVRVKAWLWRQRECCRHVDKMDMLEEFLQQCQDEVHALQLRMKKEPHAEGVEEEAEEAENEADAEEQKKKDEDRTQQLQQAEEESAGQEEPAEGERKKAQPSLTDAARHGDQVVKAAPGYEGLQTAEEHVQNMPRAKLAEWCLDLQDRIKKLNESAKYRETFADRLLADCGARLLKPQRLSKLSPEEEEARILQTWSYYDAALWVAAFGEEDTLRKFVACPLEWARGREEVVLGWSDQIPVWLKLGRSMQVYASEELVPHKRFKQSRTGRRPWRT